MLNVTPLPMELRIRLHRDHFGPVIQKTDDNTLSLLFDTGSEKNVAMARVLADEEAQVEIIGEHFYVRGARWFTVLFTAATTYRTDDPLLYCKEILDRAQRYSYAQLRARHVADYRALYERMSLRLCDDQEKNDIPTDQRIARMRTVYKEQGNPPWFPTRFWHSNCSLMRVISQFLPVVPVRCP